MFSYFTELNRKRPPVMELDFVSFTTSALVHAGDDRSVTESLESLPHIARSVHAIVGGRPYAVGPSAIGMCDNPYGARTAPNPDNIRQAMNRNDPNRTAVRPDRCGARSTCGSTTRPIPAVATSGSMKRPRYP